MTQFTLLTKAYNTNQLKQVDSLLKVNLEGLDVDAKITGVGVNRWVQIVLSGEDEAIATNLIRREVGFCPESLQNVKRFGMLKGYIVGFGKNPDTLQVDVGIFQPENIHAMVSLRHLQTTLADGRKLALKKIGELFGFCDDLPLNVKVITMDKEKNYLEAELATVQVERFNAWRESLLDRLIVLGTPLHDVKKTLRYTGLDRDIINIESLGMFEHALTCKLGTDAAGLISQVGRHFNNAKFVVFNPRKIREILNL